MSDTKAPGGRRWLLNVGVAIIVVYCLVPFYWMVVSAFRRPNDVGDNSLLPSPWSLENFDAVFGPSVGFWRSLGNSLIVAGTTTILTLIVGTFAAYTLARLDFRGKNVAAGVIIATSMFPGVSLIVPLLKLFTDIGWINTYQAMILPSLSFALPLAVWTLATFFRQMPKELEEAAMVDGLHPWAGVPQGDPAAGRAGHVHHRDHHVHRGVERVHHRADHGERQGHEDRDGRDLPVHRCSPGSTVHSGRRWPRA